MAFKIHGLICIHLLVNSHKGLKYSPTECLIVIREILGDLLLWWIIFCMNIITQLDCNDIKYSHAGRRMFQQCAFVLQKTVLQNHLSRCYERMKNKAHSNLKKENIWIGRTKQQNRRS